MLRGVPTSDYLQFERLRKDNSARRIQRLWRNSAMGMKWECEKPLFQNKSIYSIGYFNRHGVYIPNTNSAQHKRNKIEIKSQIDAINDNNNKENNLNLCNFAHRIENNPVLKERRRILLKTMTNDINVASAYTSTSSSSLSSSSSSAAHVITPTNINTNSNNNNNDNNNNNHHSGNHLCSQFLALLRKCFVCTRYLPLYSPLYLPI
jgi:hypothetical protein